MTCIIHAFLFFQLSEWLEKNDQYEFVERDYASWLDLIAKVSGLATAEAYIGKIPESFYIGTLLANSIRGNSASKAEEVFNQMRDLGFPVTSFACNQLLLLYKWINTKKIGDVLLLMEKEEVKATLFTYRILIDAQGWCNDLQGIEVDIIIHAVMAKHYVAGSKKDKAEALLRSTG